MDLNGNGFGYDYFKPSEYYSLRPEDLNPALKYNYRRDVNNYYSEPSMHRIRTGSRAKMASCPCGKSHSTESHTTLYILIICLIVITVIQWFIIFFSSGSGPVTINNISTPPPIPPVEVKKE